MNAKQIAEFIIKGYETDSGMVLGIAWIHRPALMQLLEMAAQTAFNQEADNE